MRRHESMLKGRFQKVCLMFLLYEVELGVC